MEFPKIDEDKLIDEAYWEYVDFLDNVENTGCRCFVSPPCNFCTHPGNPFNLAEDETAWEDV